MLTGHTVEFVGDQDMPDGIDWLMIEAEGAVICALRRSTLCPRVIEEAWSVYRELGAA